MAKVPYVAKIPDVGAAKICAADYIDPAVAWQACRVIRFAPLAAVGFALVNCIMLAVTRRTGEWDGPETNPYTNTDSENVGA